MPGRRTRETILELSIVAIKERGELYIRAIHLAYGIGTALSKRANSLLHARSTCGVHHTCVKVRVHYETEMGLELVPRK
jgi:hypothetical protein